MESKTCTFVCYESQTAPTDLTAQVFASH